MQLPTSLLSLLYLATTQYLLVSAGPLPKDDIPDTWGWMKSVFGRDTCAGTPCGAESQYCCVNGEQCYTDLQTIAHCATSVPANTLGSNNVAASSVWSYSTYTQTEQEVVTVTTSYYVGAAPVTSLAASTAICAAGGGCGAICCDLSYQRCGTPGQCVPLQSTTGSFSAPLRGTSSGTLSTATATTTESFSPAIGTGGSTFTPTAEASTSSKGLSPGAIAGIVIGTIAGIILLLLICFCCILKAGFDGLLGILGLRNRRQTERTEVIEERYSRHGSGTASRRETHGGWFGGGGGGRTRVTEKRKSGLGKETGVLAGIAAGLIGLWAILGLRKKKKEHRSNVSNVSYESYSDTYSGTGTSDSSASSDRRTRDSRHTSRPPR